MDAEGVPVEGMRLGLVVAERKNKNTAFFAAKMYAEQLLKELQISPEFVPIKKADGAFEARRAAEIRVAGEKIGIVGEFKNSVKHEFKLADFAAGFEIDLEKVLQRAGAKKKIDFKKYKQIDETVETEKTYAETLKEIEEKYPGAIISPGVIYLAEGAKAKNMTFHIKLML